MPWLYMTFPTPKIRRHQPYSFWPNAGVEPLRWLLSGLLLAWCVGPAQAQLFPERLYNGVDRPLIIRVDLPIGATGQIELGLFDRPNGPVVRRTSAASGRVDLAGVFGDLWETQPKVWFAQLLIDGEGLGAPLVLDPMINPDRARLVDPVTLQPTHDPSTGRLLFDSDRSAAETAAGVTPRPSSYSDAPVFAGYRVYQAKMVVWATDRGEAVFRLRPDLAPGTAFWHLHLVEGGFYRDIEFHRVVERLGDGRRFVIQVGDPTATGNGGPGFDFDLERSSLLHRFGVLSMARAGDPDTNGSQVFVALSRDGTEQLDGRYASFGELVEGRDTIDAIAGVAVDAEDRPVEPVRLREARSEPAPPIDAWPEPTTSADPDSGR